VSIIQCLLLSPQSIAKTKKRNQLAFAYGLPIIDYELICFFAT